MLLLNGDCLIAMGLLADNSVDSIVTDPPYGLSFMGRKWDYDVPAVEIWAECLRVLKPGGHLLAFAGTRTQHRMACRIEDAGFEIRDMLAWLYSTGFPKSHNGEWGGTALKPALEPITMARKPLVGTVEANWREHGTGALNIDGCRVAGDPWKAHRATGLGSVKFFSEGDTPAIDKAPHDAGRWPANLLHDGSPEVVALFPGDGDKSAARFFYRAQHDDSLRRKDGYNAACQDQNQAQSSARTAASNSSLQSLLDATVQSVAAIWPSLAGILSSGATDLSTIATPSESRLIGEAVTAAILPIAFESSRESLHEKHSPCGSRVSVAATKSLTGTTTITASLFRSDGSAVRAMSSITPPSLGLGGQASRFKYAAKASRADRDEGLDGFEVKRTGGMQATADGSMLTGSGNERTTSRANTHPTVKPTDLMRYLCRLVTPPGGVVLDPFMGSGSTGKAALLEGFDFIGIERDPEYFKIAEARCA